MKSISVFFMAMVAFLSVPVSVQALGFGVPVLKSHLNEILDVRVPLLLAEGESLNSVFVDFAQPNEYRLVGLEPYTDLSGMRIAVEHSKHGKLYVMLSSVSVMQAPIISVLLKARMGHHTYYKQVQILLDTMELGAGTHAVVAKPNSQANRIMKKVAATPTADTKLGWARTWRYGPVRSGDSLSTIAYRLRRDKQWSNHDVMLALYRFNPSAFIEHDINRLKSGVWLEIPHEKTLKKLLKQAPEAYENLAQTLKPVAKKVVKAVVKPEVILHEVKPVQASSQLRYVGRIALGESEAASPTASATLSSKDSIHLQRKLDQLYQQAMDDHLQMVSLDKNIMAMRDDIGKLSSDIVALKTQQNILQQQMLESPSSQYWMLGFLCLVLLNIILLGFFLYNRYHIKKKEKYDIEEMYFKKKTAVTPPVEEPEPVVPAPAKKQVRKKHLLENKIYDIENYLNLRDYQAVEDILKELSQAERGHFGICALRARLYHETDRLSERDELIRNKRTTLNDQQWNLLCDRLPINLWHALSEAGVIKGNGTLLHVENHVTHDDRSEAPSKTDILQPKQEDPNMAQFADTQMMPASEEDTVDVPKFDTEVADSSADFLELDDHEFKTMDEEPPDAPEDEFVSTVFISTLDGKKKLL